jgi:hypothetical protein
LLVPQADDDAFCCPAAGVIEDQPFYPGRCLQQIHWLCTKNAKVAFTDKCENGFKHPNLIN